MRIARLAVDQTGGLILGLVIGGLLFFGGFLAARSMMDATATHDPSGNIHVCVSKFTAQARFMRPGQPPSCASTEYLMEWAGPGATGDLEARVEALENQVPDCLADDSGDAVFSGCNVYIVNGLGATNTVNGTGNLIVGYNANSQTYARTGSHNVVVGDDHGYSSFGGFVAGLANQILGPSASVSGGQNNQATKIASSVSGGQNNLADGGASSVSGGQNNQATAASSSVSGGQSNTASGGASSVTGGQNNQATNANASVNGGRNNIAGGGNSSVNGGQNNQATAANSTVNGGTGNMATAGNATVSGGNTNTANNNNATVGGGANRTTATPNGWTAGGLNQPN